MIQWFEQRSYLLFRNKRKCTDWGKIQCQVELNEFVFYPVGKSRESLSLWLVKKTANKLETAFFYQSQMTHCAAIYLLLEAGFIEILLFENNKMRKTIYAKHVIWQIFLCFFCYFLFFVLVLVFSAYLLLFLYGYLLQNVYKVSEAFFRETV